MSRIRCMNGCDMERFRRFGMVVIERCRVCSFLKRHINKQEPGG